MSPGSPLSVMKNSAPFPTPGKPGSFDPVDPHPDRGEVPHDVHAGDLARHLNGGRIAGLIPEVPSGVAPFASLIAFTPDQARRQPALRVTLEVSGDGASLDDSQLVSLVRQRSITVVRTARSSSWARRTAECQARRRSVGKIGEQTLCTREKVSLDDLAEFERKGVSFARVRVPAEQVAS